MCIRDRQYTVQGGDTIGSIAGSFNVTEQQLREWNNLPNDDIFAGQSLRVPEGDPCLLYTSRCV